MKKVLKLTILLTIIFSLINNELKAEAVQYTLKDRDRLVRMEALLQGHDKQFEQIDKRFEQIERRIERLENIMMWGFGLLFTAMIGLVGFVLWDRRTALSPAISKNRELEEREERVERVLKNYANINPDFRKILKDSGLY